jgi:hypothetical protein
MGLIFPTMNKMNMLMIMGIIAIVPLALGTIDSVVAQDNVTTDLGSTVSNEVNYTSDANSYVTTPTGNVTITVDNSTSNQ